MTTRVSVCRGGEFVAYCFCRCCRCCRSCVLSPRFALRARSVAAITPASDALVNPLTSLSRSFSDGDVQGLGAPDCGHAARGSTLKGLLMKRVATAFATAACCLRAARRPPMVADAESGARRAASSICGANGQLAGFGMPDPQGNWTGFDVDFCRAIAAAIFNDPTKVKFVPLDRGQPLHRAAVGRSRRAAAQHHLDDVARHHARHRFRRGQFLRRPGLHGAQGAEGQLGARAQRRRGLRAAGHHHRAQSRRLFPFPQHVAQDRDLRHRRRGGQGLRHRPLRCLHHRFSRRSTASGCS